MVGAEEKPEEELYVFVGLGRRSAGAAVVAMGRS